MNLSKYNKAFSEKAFWKKWQDYVKKLGTKALYTLLLLFYAYKRKETPYWAKSIVIGTIGYLLTPIDAIPDLTPILGYTDDLGILSFGLVTIACYVNEDVRQSARTKLGHWIHGVDEQELQEVDAKL
ncbi:MAG: YkvA family protein [Saprospiraceae bacterium]